jgi:multidrug efflux pump subunit AcrB
MNRKVHEKKGLNSIRMVTDGVMEMIPAIVSSTATTVAVYVPIALIGGEISSAFSGFAWSVVIALVVSLFVSIMVVPVLYNLFWKGKPVAVGDQLEPFAQKMFTWVFKRKGKVAVATLGLFLTTVVVAALLPINFLPTSHTTGQVGVRVEMPQNTSLTEVDAEVQRLEGYLRKIQRSSLFRRVLVPLIHLNLMMFLIREEGSFNNRTLPICQ